MTVIAWDGTTLAVDSLVTFDNRRTYSDKLVKAKSGEVIAMCGNMDICTHMLAMYQANKYELSDFPAQAEGKESYLVIATRDGVSVMGEGAYPYKINDQKFALGTGGDFAIAAMHCGKSAVEAVEIACIYDVYCGGKVLFHSFLGPADKPRKK
jgi:hypothetical protein